MDKLQFWLHVKISASLYFYVFNLRLFRSTERHCNVCKYVSKCIIIGGQITKLETVYRKWDVFQTQYIYQYNYNATL